MLVSTQDMLRKARKEGYAVPSPDFLDSNSARAYCQVAGELHSPLILSFAEVHLEHLSIEEAAMLGKHYAERFDAPIALHLDHGVTFSVIEEAIAHGFTSVMIDASKEDLAENIRRTCAVVELAHARGVRVPMASSKETVALIAPKLVEHLGLASGDKAFVMINGCGATTMMEQLILCKDTVEYLNGLGIEVVANMVGEILTVQEAGGFQMNIAKWDDEFIRLWNTPAHTPVFFKE